MRRHRGRAGSACPQRYEMRAKTGTNLFSPMPLSDRTALAQPEDRTPPNGSIARSRSVSHCANRKATRWKDRRRAGVPARESRSRRTRTTRKRRRSDEKSWGVRALELRHRSAGACRRHQACDRGAIAAPGTEKPAFQGSPNRRCTLCRTNVRWWAKRRPNFLNYLRKCAKSLFIQEEMIFVAISTLSPCSETGKPLTSRQSSRV